MYAVTSNPFVRRTRATLRRAEFGFFGVVVYTRTQTPRFCGQDFRAGESVLVRTATRPLRTSWLMVGIRRASFREISRKNPPRDTRVGGSAQSIQARRL